jgi:hypothetical protein
MDFFVLMLAIPLASGALLTVVGERDWAVLHRFAERLPGRA